MGPLVAFPTSLKMPKSEGYRCSTRDMFSRPFRQRGMPNLTTYLTNYKLGDYVDIKANSAIQKGKPHKYYHGRTAAKRVHVRVEHVVPSRCREEFLNRVKKNDAAKIEAKKSGTTVVTKRQPRMPKVGFTVKKAEVLTRAPVPYDPIY